MEKEEIFLRESNAIEGEFSEVAFQDAQQAWTCGLIILKSEQLSVDLICAIHRRLMKRLNSDIAGKIRNVPVYIGGERRDQSKLQIDKELRLLVNEWNMKFRHYVGGGSEAEKFVKRWHIAFEKTHPFCDGNGRIGRILMNLQRLYLGLPLLIIYDKEKREYYKWFK